MSLRDLLVLVDRSPASAVRLEWALALAARFSSRVTALYLVAEPYVPAMIGVHIPVDLLQMQLAEAEREADAVLAAVRASAQRHGLAVATDRITAPLGRLPTAMAQAARAADLCVVGQPTPEDQDLDSLAIAEAAFIATGRPALVVPYAGTPATPLRRVLVAWNGSREAARAVHDALPFVVGGVRTTLLVVDPQGLGAVEPDAPGAEIAAHLARHGVTVEVKAIQSGGLPIGDAILSQAADEGADLLVMGGYGHSRLRETVLGGATRQILAQMTLPVLLSH